MMRKYRDIFIILTYRNNEDLIECLNSLKQTVNNYKVIIINSHYDTQSTHVFSDIASKFDCDFIDVENKGYGAGNNKGIQFAVNNYQFDRIVISNPDIIVKKYDQDKLDKIKGSIIGGIIKNRNGKLQNPLRVYNKKITTFAAYQYYCKGNKMLFLLGICVAKFHRVSSLIMNYYKSSYPVFAVHGSFVVFKEDFIRNNIPIFDENIFMFNEELDLALRTYKDKSSTIMTNSIEVLHKEDGSIKLSGIKENEKMSESCAYVYNKYNSVKERNQ